MSRDTGVKNKRWRCPVCWQRAMPTSNGHISLHPDSVNKDTCPASGEPFEITQPYFPQSVYVFRRARSAA